MKVGFQCPINGVPCIGEWNEDEEVLGFYIEDEEEALKWISQEVIDETNKWCKRSEIRCENEEQGSNHLTYLGIKEGLGVW